MNKDSGIKLIQTTFENSFSKESFTYYIKNLLNHIEDAPFVYRGHYIPGIYQDDILTIERIGKYQDINGKTIDILIVSLKKDTSLERARSLQRNIIAWYLNGSRGDQLKDAALVAFISPNSQDWRFSFVKMEYKFTKTDKGHIKVKEQFTPAKRYSFLVGPYEASHTAQSRMLPLMLNDEINPTLEEIEDIFSVEKVTDEFFKKYKELFLNLFDEFSHNKEFNKEVVEKHGIRVSDFVKKLMGQIVFLYFLQKKGWLGVEQEKKWGLGDKRFMRNLFDKKYREYQNFFNNILEPLFYDTLNKKDRGNSDVKNDQSYSPYFKCRIPYLNGGLFNPNYEWAQTEINIDNKYFKDILDVFDLFNFTVYESDPIEKEVAVDPEMLGKVFENLLDVQDRKSKGAFYTPREIVHYMCRESLINYLITFGDFPEKRMRDLMENKDIAIARTEKDKIKIENTQDLKEIAAKVNDLLKVVKICDPAVGSGAFPMGLLKEITNLRYYLNNHFVKEKNKYSHLLTEYDIKKQTLENCIYGVDIDPGAVEIARLRFWLSLVVEHDIEDIEPLPNLDYKIMQGNSLIELLSPELLAKSNDDERNQLIDKLSIAKHEYFNLSDFVEKNKKRDEINLLISNIINFDTRKKQKNIWAKIKDMRSQMGLFNKKMPDEQLNIGDITTKEISKEFKELNNIENVSNTDHFEWHLNFNEVFEKGGFDIVIGNPPYVQLQKLKGNPIQAVYKNAGFQTYDSNGDIYCLFFEKGLTLTKIRNGLLCYITSNKWMRAQYGEKLRTFFAKNIPKVLIDCGPGIFESATVDTSILLINHNNPSHYSLKSLTLKGNDINDIGKAVINNSSVLTDLQDGPWFIGSNAEIELKKKIKILGTPLKDWNINIYRGVLSGLNAAFIIDTSTKEKLCREESKNIEIIKPILRGRDLGRFTYNWAGLWMIFLPWHFPLHNDPTIDGSSKKAELEFKEKYSSIYNHLVNYKESLLKRNKAETGIRYEWYVLQRCAATYYPEFNKEKVIWQEMTQEPTFSYDNQNFFCSDTGRILTGRNIKFFTGFFNSKFFKYTFSKYYSGGGLGEKGIRYKSDFMKNFPIPPINSQNKSIFENIENIVNLILEKKQNNIITKDLESQISKYIYKLYDLTPEEIKIIEENKNG